MGQHLPGGSGCGRDGEVVANNHKQAVGVEVIGDRDYAVVKSALPVVPDVYQPGDIVPQLEAMPVVDTLLDPAIISDLIDMAKPVNYYVGNERPSTDVEWEGIVVIQTSGTVDLPNSGVFNSNSVGSNKMPGVLIVVGPNFPDGPASGGLDTNGHAGISGACLHQRRLAQHGHLRSPRHAPCEGLRHHGGG